MIKDTYRVIEVVGQSYTYEVEAENELEASLLVQSGKAGQPVYTNEMRPTYTAHRKGSLTNLK